MPFVALCEEGCIIFGAYGIINVALGTFGLDAIQTTLPPPG